MGATLTRVKPRRTLPLGLSEGPSVRKQPPDNRELKTAITARIRAVPIEECFRVIDNFARLLQVCLQHQGGRLEHVLEKTYKSDYLTYKLEALWNDHAKTEDNMQ